MAIARDSATTTITATGLATSITRSHTCTGANNVLFASCETATISSDNITEVTYNSVSFFTQLVARAASGSDAQTYVYWKAEGTGDETAHNIVFTCSTADVFRAYSQSYTDVDQTDPIDASNTNIADTVNTDEVLTTITVVADNCWALMVETNDRGKGIANTNATLLNTGDATGYGAFDSNGTVATGSFSMGWDAFATGHQATVLASFKPVVAAGTAIKSIAGVAHADIKSIAGVIIE